VADKSGVLDYGRDVLIANTLRSKLFVDSRIKNINYSVDTVNGVVYVMGIAQDEAELERVIAYARDIGGVKRVISHVRMRNDPRRLSP
jgi:osmotically-inducible protein OsmY